MLPKKNRNDDALSSVMYGKIPPQAPDLEEAVLGAMMIDKMVIHAVIGIIQPESFYDDRHRIIYTAIIHLFNSTGAIDILTVSEELRKMGQLEEAGGPFYVSQLTNRIASTAHVEHHARIVQQKYLSREIIRISSESVHEAYDDVTDVFELLKQLQKDLYVLTNKIFSKENVQINYLIDNALTNIETNTNNNLAILGVKSGFKKFDRVTLGFQPGRLYIVAARPGMGKTSFVLQVARNAALDGSPVAFFSLEMNNADLVQKLISVETEVPLQKIQEGSLTADEKLHIRAAVSEIKQAPLFLDDTSNLSVFELIGKARKLKLEQDIKLIIVDYLQLMNGIREGRKEQNKEEEISYISNSLKNLSKDLDVPVIALSQLSRELEKRTNKQPILSDLRNSGAIEQDADVVVFLYRPEYYKIATDENGRSTAGKCKVIIEKNRHGKLDEQIFDFKGQFTKFFETL